MQSALGLDISGLSVGSSTHDIRKTKGPDKKAVNDFAKLNGLQLNMQKCDTICVLTPDFPSAKQALLAFAIFSAMVFLLERYSKI